MANYTSVLLDGFSTHRSRWLDARNSLTDYLTINVPATLSGTITIEGTSSTSVVLAELAANPNPANSDSSAASSSDVTSDCAFSGSLTVSGGATLSGTFAGSSTFIRVKWVPSAGSGTIVITASDEAGETPDDPTAPSTEALQESRGVRIEKFAPNEELTAANFDSALRAALDWCVANSTLYFAYNVVIPAGEWTVQPVPYVFHGTLPAPTAGIIGSGASSCVLVVDGDLPVGRGLFELGDDIADTLAYTSSQTLRGFTVLTDKLPDGWGTGGVGIGIRGVATYRCTIEDVQVQGFGANQHFDSGFGIAFEEPTAVGTIHQHLTLKDVNCSLNQSGIKLCGINQLTSTNLNVNQNLWRSMVWGKLNGASFTGGNLQDSDLLTSDFAGSYWYARALTPTISTDWSYTTGLASGTTATLSTTTIADDSDTGISGSGTCTLSGVTGMTLYSVGNWIELQRSSNPYASGDVVSGLYQIVEYISATSVKINKGTNHSAQTANVTWQVRGQAGGNNVCLSGFPYHEGYKRCVVFVGPDLSTASMYDLRGVMSQNTMPLIAQGATDVSLTSAGPFTGKAVRAERVTKLNTTVPVDRIVMDSWARTGTVARRKSRSITSGLWQGSESPARRLNSFATERGGWSFDPKRADKHTLSTTDIVEVRSVQDDTITLAPQYSGSKPSYVASDSSFGGPCWNLAGGGAGVTKNLVGTIPNAKLPNPSGKIAPTWLVVARLPNTTVDSVAQRRMMLRSSASGNDFQVAFNDGAFGTGICFVSAEGSSGNSSGQIRTGVDTNPHAYAVRWDMSGPGTYGNGLMSDELVAPGTDYELSSTSGSQSRVAWPGGADLQVWLCRDFGGGNAGLLVRWVGVIPYPLCETEIEQFMDMAANECGVSR